MSQRQQGAKQDHRTHHHHHHLHHSKRGAGASGRSALTQNNTTSKKEKNLPVASKCLAIVLLPQKKAKEDAAAILSDNGKPSACASSARNDFHDHVGHDKDGDGTRYCVSVEEERIPDVHHHTSASVGIITAIQDNSAVNISNNIGKHQPDQRLLSVTTTGTVQSPSATVPNGKEILDDFKQQNQTCYWNPALVESIKQLDYLGFVEPCTVLVTGEDIHLENLRSAWGRRVLKPPSNFTIERIGDVNGIEMQVIPQTQFIPLPDSLCLIITELNGAHKASGGRQPATLEAVRQRLQRWYSNTNLPSHQLIYDTLGQLIRERKVIHDGTGYVVVTPEMYRMTPTDPSMTATAASWLPYHPMYIPVFPPSHGQPPFRAPTRSISCQVTQIGDKSTDSSVVAEMKKKAWPRSHSVRACRGKSKAAHAEKENAIDFRRSASARFKADKAKVGKDLNLKSSNSNPEKEKGEKVSLFSKLFRRKKKSASTGTATSASNSSTTGGATQSTEAEFATFSAQFPPPEWVWYQQQLERQRRTEEWVTQQLPKSATWGHFCEDGRVPSSGQAEPGSSQTGFTESSHPYSTAQHLGILPYPVAKPRGHVYASVISSGVGEVAKAGLNGDGERKIAKQQHHRVSGAHIRRPHQHRELHKHHRKTLQENNYDVPVSSQPNHLHHQHHYVQQDYGVIGDVPPNAHPQTHLHPDTVIHNSLDDDNIYSTPGPSQCGGAQAYMPWHSTPRYDVPPSQMDSLAMPSNIVPNNTTSQNEQSDATGRVGPHPNQTKRAHKSKRRGQKAYNLFEANPGGDISIEYKGRMPKKNSSVAQSRDSGVNCVGLPPNRRHYLEEAELYTTQEASAYLPGSRFQDVHTTISSTNNTAMVSSHLHDSTQRGTPYTSMDQREPEGCSQLHHQNAYPAVINPIGPNSPNSTCEPAMLESTGSNFVSGDQRGSTLFSQASRKEESVGRNQGSHLDCRGGSIASPLGMDERSEGEGVSHHSTPHYIAVGSDSTEMHQDDVEAGSIPQYMTMSYCDSSMGDEGAGGGEVMLCQAEVHHHFQVPELVLDSESRREWVTSGNLSSEPDIALSSAGSKDTLDRTADESERSTETVVRSPLCDKYEDNGREDLNRTSSDRSADQGDSGAKDGDVTASASGAVERKMERCAVSELGSEFQEMGVTDSGFSSPRNSNDKDAHNNQQPRVASTRSSVTLTAVPVTATSLTAGTSRSRPSAQCTGTAATTDEEFLVPAVPAEHRSKHERIKAFVKQSNQHLEEKQYGPPVMGNAYRPDHDGGYVNYPVHPAVYSQPGSTAMHYGPAPLSVPVYPTTQHHHPQQAGGSQRLHYYHLHAAHHSSSSTASRSQLGHGGPRERPKSQNVVWPSHGSTAQAQPSQGQDRVSPADLKVFQQQQMKGKKFVGLNGEFEVVGIV